jgi:hypothetical protein
VSTLTRPEAFMVELTAEPTTEPPIVLGDVRPRRKHTLLFEVLTEELLDDSAPDLGGQAAPG